VVACFFGPPCIPIVGMLGYMLRSAELSNIELATGRFTKKQHAVGQVKSQSWTGRFTN